MEAAAGERPAEADRSRELGALSLLPGAFESPADGDAVVGGQQVEPGDWDDAVGIVFFSSFVGCTGTLVGPRVVLTAGHCVIDYPVSHVVVGSKNWATNQGEILEVDEVFEYPNSQSSYDIAVLTLSEPSSYDPRTIALDCILDKHLEDNAPVQIVGFGATDERGQDSNNTRLNEVASRVTDADCDRQTINGVYAGCVSSISPGGEIAAGGNGKDACFGDSGGPLYLKTDEGDFLVGVTSRALLGVSPQFPCRDGGIWVRPDAVIDWIEDKVGNLKMRYPDCNEEPEASVDDIETVQDEPKTVTVEVDDPDGDDDEAELDVIEEPEHGEVEIDGLEVTYIPDEGYVGEDSFVLEVTDEGTKYRRTGDPKSIELEVDVEVLEKAAGPLQGGLLRTGVCGCGTAGPGAGWIFALAGLLLIRRQRS